MSAALEVNAGQFDAEVTNASTPVLVDFWAPWCGPCKMIAPVLDQIAAEFAGKVKVVKVNVDNERALAGKFGIQGIPTLLLFKGGQLVDKLVGAQPKNVIADKLNAALS